MLQVAHAPVDLRALFNMQFDRNIEVCRKARGGIAAGRPIPDTALLLSLPARLGHYTQ